MHLRHCLAKSNINIQDTAVGVQWEIDGIQLNDENEMIDGRPFLRGGKIH